MKKNVKSWIFCGLISLLLLINGLLSGSAQASVQSDFINRFKPTIVRVAHRYNLYPSVMMAQAALESDFGQSLLAQDANNYFGIKGSYDGQSVTVPVMEYNQQEQPYYTSVAFRKYPYPKASIEDNARLIRDNGSLYGRAWRENAANSTVAANALGDKYATDPSYANKLISLIQGYNLDSRLDNAWRNIYTHRLRKYIRKDLHKAHRYHRRYNRFVVPKRKNYNKKRWALKIKYGNLYKDSQAQLAGDYQAYNLYDHLSRLEPASWARLSAYGGKSVYIDMMARRNGLRYYRIRSSRTTRNMYWVNSNALSFVQTLRYFHPYMINAQQINRSRAYNLILGTSLQARPVKKNLRKSIYHGNELVLSSSRANPTWYHIKNDRGRYVWVTGNPRRPTQYLDYSESKTMSPYYRQAPLQSHAMDPGYRNRIRSYSWSNVKPVRNRVNVDHLAINTTRHNQLWYRIHNHHHNYWTNLAAFNA